MGFAAPPTGDTMTKSFSLYLDGVRFAAALAVFLDHLSSYPFTKGLTWHYVNAYGSVAVIIFFVLSGYVIAHVSATRECNARDYFAARAARLYSVVGIALVLTFAADRIGMHFNPDFYTIPKVLLKPESWAGYLSSAVFLNEFQVFGFNGIAPGTNAPYWSLSFEATYYVIAGLALFCRRAIWIPATLVLLALAGKTIAALLPIWALGFFLYHARPRRQPPVWLSVLLFLITAAVVLAAPAITGHLPKNHLGIAFPWGLRPNRSIIGDYIAALAFTGHLFFARRLLSTAQPMPQVFDATVRWLGSLTFPLYCLHYPMICLLAAISPWGNDSIANLLFIAAVTLGTVIVLTPPCDHLKGVIRRALLPRGVPAPNVGESSSTGNGGGLPTGAAHSGPSG